MTDAYQGGSPASSTPPPPPTPSESIRPKREAQTAADAALAAAATARDLSFSSTLSFHEVLDALMRACGYVPAVSHELAKLIHDEDERAEMGAALLALARTGMPATQVRRMAQEFAMGYVAVPIHCPRCAEAAQQEHEHDWTWEGTCSRCPARRVDAGETQTGYVPATDAAPAGETQKTRPIATHRVTWDGDKATFHCDGDQESACRNYPSCGCELFVECCRAEHQAEPQAECWQLTWLKAEDVNDSYAPDDGWAWGDPVPRRDGVIETTWEGDYLSWCYAAPTDKALIVGRDLSPQARKLAAADGWAPHARMHRKTAADYEQRASRADQLEQEEADRG